MIRATSMVQMVLSSVTDFLGISGLLLVLPLRRHVCPQVFRLVKTLKPQAVPGKARGPLLIRMVFDGPPLSVILGFLAIALT